MRKTVLGFATALSFTGPALADGFSDVEKKSDFLTLISGKSLTRFGIRLDVSPEGQIEGRAFGQPVTGAWTWQRGFFCRDLAFGSQDLGPNCQRVRRNGDVLRFISDEGQGDSADLRLR